MRFEEEIRKILSQIPKGYIATYGEMAKALGDVRASRAVFDFLSRHPQESHQVVNSHGKVRSHQIKPLEEDGVKVEGGLVRDMNRILFEDFQTDYPLRNLRREQEKLAGKVVLKDGFKSTERICGFDLAYEGSKAICAFAVVESEGLDVLEKGSIVRETEFPYIPSYLTYREFPAIRDAFKEVKSDMDVLLIDGHGFLHPRRSGIACHVGVKLRKPTVGVAKNLLLGRVEREPSEPGDFERVMENGDMLGYALRSSTSKRPIYISPGHLVSFESSVRITRTLCKDRIPEPLKVAHRVASSHKQG
jgi:deoxyribonuclease V